MSALKMYQVSACQFVFVKRRHARARVPSRRCQESDLKIYKISKKNCLTDQTRTVNDKFKYKCDQINF